MSSIFNKLKVTKSEGMSGIGADQGALRDTLEASDSSSFNPDMAKESGAEPYDEIGSGKGKQLDRAPNTVGGPSFGRTSTIPKHKSEALNKVDPRIGFDDDKVREEDLERYETKYGKPSDVSDGHLRGTTMSGIGSDQSALGEAP